ncbi:MAG: 5'-nucleotidase C-terminal domain-containing protein [Anaerolineae bacterium]|nr:5'-nucleotidase C-terminal domain-containing protein [Anaerolineae bacterium]
MRTRIVIIATVVLLLLSVSSVAAQQETTITLLHFSDYHSHAVPFYSEGATDTAGIARAIAYLKPYANDPDALILSGGDMINKGSPAWSDKYQCAEWSWFNGITKAMAFGNHDADYGADVFAQCQTQIDYPILGGNVLDSNGQPLFQPDGKTYKVFDVGGMKIGVFAMVGPDYERLLTPETLPVAGATFADRIEATRAVVKALREEEQVDAVVLIGHALYEDDVALAQAVPGIDLIFGSHSHRKEELTSIPGTDTVIISPFQYLTYISKVEFTFANGTLEDISGELVPMSSDLPEDPDIAQQVAQMQADLEANTDYEYLFQPIGEASVELSTEGQFTGEAGLGNFVTDIVRNAAQAHMAIFTASGFRQPIAPGEILEQDLLTAMPYKNAIFSYEMTGAQIQELLDYSVSRSGSDFFSQVSGIRFNIVDDKATNIQILNDPADSTAGYSPLDPAQTYQVATSNFQGLFAGGYKDIFAPAPYTETGLDVWDEVRQFIQTNSPVEASLDGRIVSGPPAEQPAEQTPAALPVSGGASTAPWALPVGGLVLVVLGRLIRRRIVTPI